MVFMHHYNFEDMDDEELRDLLDESEDPEFVTRIESEIAKRATDRANNPPRYGLVTAIIVGLFALVALLVFLVVR